MFSRNFERLFNEFFNSDPFFGNGNNWDKKSFQSPDGSISFTYITNKKSDNKKSDELISLKEELNLAVEEQNFEMAVELRDKIKNLEENNEKISELNKELEDCIKTQDFERAIEVRDKINSLK
jgi:protein-arginine kinase activator protein McsA